MNTVSFRQALLEYGDPGACKVSFPVEEEAAWGMNHIRLDKVWTGLLEVSLTHLISELLPPCASVPSLSLVLVDVI